MSIDFATVDSLEIPEGNVVKITDTNDVVLWEAVKKATVTINSTCTTEGHGLVQINAKFPATPGATPTNPAVIEATSGNWSYRIPIGTVIECSARYIYVDGDTISYMYDYTVTKDVTITMQPASAGSAVGEIRIVEN
jgi:hypothetical protein